MAERNGVSIRVSALSLSELDAVLDALSGLNLRDRVVAVGPTAQPVAPPVPPAPQPAGVGVGGLGPAPGWRSANGEGWRPTGCQAVAASKRYRQCQRSRAPGSWCCDLPRHQRDDAP